MMKNRNKPIQAALFFCIIPMFLATSSCTTQDTNTVNLHSWTKDVNSLAKGKADSKFWSKVRSRSNLVDAYKRLGGFYQKQGKHREAIAEFIKAIKSKTGDAGVYNSLAMSYDALKEYKFAEMAYKDAIALAPEQPYLYNNYGCSSLLRGDIDAAVALFEKAASLDSESSRIKNNLSLAIYRGNKNEMLNRGNQEAAQLPGLYVTKRKPTDNTELKTEIDSSDMVASVFPDKTEETAVQEVSGESVAETALAEEVQDDADIRETQPVLVQPEVEEIAAKKVLGESVTEATVVEEVQDEEVIADETQPVLHEDVVTKTVEVVEKVKVDSETPAEVVETIIDEKIPAESSPAQVVTDDRKETTSIAAISSDDETSWYNDLFVSVLAALGFENDGKKAEVVPSVESDQPAVVLTNTELIDEESIIDTPVTENEPQEILTVIQGQPEEQVVSTKTEDDISIKAVELIEPFAIIEDSDENHLELPTVENVENELVEKEAIETDMISTVEVPEATVEATVGETKDEVFEVVSTEDDTIDEEVNEAVHAANTEPESGKEELAVMAQSDENPEVVTEISVDTKAAGIIQVKALVVDDTLDDISSQSSASIVEAQVSTPHSAASVKKNVIEVTDNGQDAQGNKKVAIEVSNGNGVEGMATRSAAYFREQGENIRRITNAKHFGFKDSIVFYREGYLQEAYKVAFMVPGYQEMKQVESLGRPEISVRLLLGKDMVPLHFPESMVGISRQKISTYRETVTLLSR